MADMFLLGFYTGVILIEICVIAVMIGEIRNTNEETKKIELHNAQLEQEIRDIVHNREK